MSLRNAPNHPAKKTPPLALRISITDRCPMRCLYCMPPAGVPKKNHDEILTFEEIARFVRVLKSAFDVSKVRITGGEPLIRTGVVDLISMLSGQGIDDLALTTNGQLLSEMADDLKRAGLKRVNVSLDSLDEATFRELTGGGRLQETLEGIGAAVHHGLLPVRLNAVVLRGINDTEVGALARFGIEHGCEMRFLELMPIGTAKGVWKDLFVPADEVRKGVEEAFRLEPLDHEAGQSSRNFRASDGQGRQGIIGFISPETQPFCLGCTRIRLTSTGRLISCLADGKGLDIRGLLRNNEPKSVPALQNIVSEMIACKGVRSAFETSRPMVDVGG
ncbi:MAG: GTP 3',8-cyclase MoaA [Planctomycetia bacterium]|nr:GTP 3',8-cyclase MoaA [Planctomycetia bacterium]